VTSIGTDAFFGCTSLTAITVDSENPVFDSRDNCNAIIRTQTNTLVIGCQTTVIPNTVTTIGDYAFYRCSALKSITIPNSVTTIGTAAFQSCHKLTSLTLGSSLTFIGEAAFFGCENLSEVTSLIESPFEIADNNFMLEDETTPNATRMTGATLYVPAGTKTLYEATTAWNMFTEIKEFAQGDVNNDGSVGIADIVAITNIMAGGE